MELSPKPYLATLLLFLAITSYSSLLYNAYADFSVELIHRDSPKSPYYDPTESPYQRLQKSVNRSIARANHIAAIIDQDPMDPKVLAEDYGWEYIITLSLGTPQVEVKGIMDTGSSLIWTQCPPCVSCFNQTSPMFDPSKSSTYEDVSCHDSQCGLTPNGKCDAFHGDVCSYQATYGRNTSSSIGNVGMDNVTVDTVTGARIVFSKFLIGCGYDNRGGPNLEGPISGIFGLGPKPISLVNQMGGNAGGKFAYCLIPLKTVTPRGSILRFGNSAAVSGPGTVSTPLGFDVHYWLTLEGVTVGPKTIQNSYTVPGAPGNVMIDSGTTVTFLDLKVYSEMVAAVKEHIKLKPVEDAERLCYSGEFEAPSITVNFKGADVKLGAENMFMKIEEDLMCFAFRPMKEGGKPTYGSFNQMNFWVEYDLPNKVVSFKQTDCNEAY